MQQGIGATWPNSSFNMEKIHAELAESHFLWRNVFCNANINSLVTSAKYMHCIYCQYDEIMKSHLCMH